MCKCWMDEKRAVSKFDVLLFEVRDVSYYTWEAQISYIFCQKIMFFATIAVKMVVLIIEHSSYVLFIHSCLTDQLYHLGITITFNLLLDVVPL